MSNNVNENFSVILFLLLIRILKMFETTAVIHFGIIKLPGCTVDIWFTTRLGFPNSLVWLDKISCFCLKTTGNSNFMWNNLHCSSWRRGQNTIFSIMSWDYWYCQFKKNCMSWNFSLFQVNWFLMYGKHVFVVLFAIIIMQDTNFWSTGFYL